MFANRKKGLTQLALTIALAVAVGQCAWAAFNQDNKLALSTDGISVFNPMGEDKNMYLDENEKFIIDANDPEAVSVPYTTRLTGNIQIAKEGEKVTLSLRDADVKQVLRMFADKANMNIVFHNSAAGQVTLDLKDVSVNTALEFVLDACELTYVRQDNNIIVASKVAAKDLAYSKQNFTTIPVKYANANTIAIFLNKTMFNGKYQGVSSIPVVATNASKNELMILGTEEDEKLVKKLLVKLDVKPMLNIFPVNHVSPQEMAATLCDTILADKSEGGSEGVNITTERSGGSDDQVELGGGFAACVVGEKSGNVEKMEDTEDLTNYVSNPLQIVFFPTMGTVAAYGGSREQVKMVENFIKLHDKKQPMAYIEFSLIQLSESGSKDFNTEWKVWTPFGSFEFDANGFRTNPVHPIFFDGHEYGVVNEQGEVEYVVKRAHSHGPLVLNLNYLVSNGKGRVLASPKIMVTNGKKSTIDLTSDYVKSVKREFDTNSTTAISQTTYEIANDNGIKLEVTPFISPEGYVVMNLKPDYAQIKESAQGGEYTLLTRRNLELEAVRVKDGETLVIGGLIQEDERQTIQKMPILGDLPVVGPFFRRTSSTSAKEELVILVTPHIVYSKDQIDAIKAAKKENL